MNLSKAKFPTQNLQFKACFDFPAQNGFSIDKFKNNDFNDFYFTTPTTSLNLPMYNIIKPNCTTNTKSSTKAVIWSTNTPIKNHNSFHMTPTYFFFNERKKIEVQKKSERRYEKKILFENVKIDFHENSSQIVYGNHSIWVKRKLIIPHAGAFLNEWKNLFLTRSFSKFAKICKFTKFPENLMVNRLNFTQAQLWTNFWPSERRKYTNKWIFQRDA